MSLQVELDGFKVHSNPNHPVIPVFQSSWLDGWKLFVLTLCPTLEIVYLYFLRTDPSGGIPPDLAESWVIDSALLMNPLNRDGQMHWTKIWDKPTCAAWLFPASTGMLDVFMGSTGEATVPHCPHSIGRIKRIIDLIAMTVAHWIAGGSSVQNSGMQETPTPFPVATLGCSFLVCGIVVFSSGVEWPNH